MLSSVFLSVAYSSCFCLFFLFLLPLCVLFSCRRSFICFSLFLLCFLLVVIAIFGSAASSFCCCFSVSFAAGLFLVLFLGFFDQCSHV